MWNGSSRGLDPCINKIVLFFSIHFLPFPTTIASNEASPPEGTRRPSEHFEYASGYGMGVKHRHDR